MYLITPFFFFMLRSYTPLLYIQHHAFVARVRARVPAFLPAYLCFILFSVMYFRKTRRELPPQSRAGKHKKCVNFTCVCRNMLREHARAFLSILAYAYIKLPPKPPPPAHSASRTASKALSSSSSAAARRSAAPFSPRSSAACAAATCRRQTNHGAFKHKSPTSDDLQISSRGREGEGGRGGLGAARRLLLCPYMPAASLKSTRAVTQCDEHATSAATSINGNTVVRYVRGCTDFSCARTGGRAPMRGSGAQTYLPSSEATIATKAHPAALPYVDTKSNHHSFISFRLQARKRGCDKQGQKINRRRGTDLLRAYFLVV